VFPGQSDQASARPPEREGELRPQLRPTSRDLCRGGSRVSDVTPRPAPTRRAAHPVAPAPAASAPLPRAPGTVLRNRGDLATPSALRVAAALRIVDHLNAGTTRLADLAVATELPEDVLGRVLRHLVAVDVLTEMPAGTFAPTAVGALLAHGHPQSAAGWLNTEHMMGRADLAFVDLLKAMWSGHTAYRLRYGTDFWADALAANRSATFDAAMARDGKASFRAVNAAYDWSGVRHVLDVRGGNGTLLRALLRGQPHLRATLLELSGPAAAARAAFTERGSPTGSTSSSATSSSLSESAQTSSC